MLGQYLREVVATPFGLDGCCSFAGDWVVRCGHGDPMAYMRGKYATEEDVAELLRKPGLLRLVQRGVERVGLKQTLVPVSGDIGVVVRPTDDGIGHACAIRSGERWVTRSDHGLEVGEAPAVRAWSVPQ